jgi:uncharacterized membrane protein YfcA
MPISASTLIVPALAVFMASVTTGCTGFGFNLVATPLLVAVLPPRMVVPMLGCLGTVHSTLMWLQLREGARLTQMWPLIIAAMVGVPLGTYLLLLLEVNLLKLLIGSTSVLAAVALMFGLRHPIADGKRALSAVGLLGGVLGGSTGISGPPLVLFLANQGVRKQEFRANLSAYFAAVGWMMMVSYAAGGLLSKRLVFSTAILLPVALVGLRTGMMLEYRVNEITFRRLTLVTLVASSLVVIFSALH